jgi:pyocin large subunit-like protein
LTRYGFTGRDDGLLTSSGSVVAVGDIERHEGKFKVYNFEVEQAHDYFVSGLSVLAHNACWNPKKGGTGPENAKGHYEKHGGEFPEYPNATQYAKGAKEFLNDPPAGSLSKVRPNGETVIYDPATNTFGVKTAGGVPKTMFRPNPTKHGYPTNKDYFDAQ